MEEVDITPELKQILGAMLFAAKSPMSATDMRKTLEQVAATRGGPAKDFGEVSEADIREALGQLKRDLESNHVGVHLSEVANGYRLQNDVSCGPWLRQMLERGKGNRLSMPALETLAIIAYRQPAMRSEIEAVRGVAVDQILRNLLDMQLVRITGRSDLPGRPWLFGTTQKFLEFFGLKNVQDLPGVEELRRIEEERAKKAVLAAVENEEPTVIAGDDDPNATEIIAESPAPAANETVKDVVAEEEDPATSDSAEASEEDEDEYDDEDEDEDEEEEEDEDEEEKE